MENNISIYNLYYKWWKNVDKFILFLIILLFSTGLFFSLVSTSLLVSDKLETNDYDFFFKHLSFVLLGVVTIFILSSIDEKKLYKITPIIFIITLISLFLVPLIGVEVNSAQRWIDLYLLPRFQPIELVKPFMIISISIILSSEKYTNVYFKYLFSFLISFKISFKAFFKLSKFLYSIFPLSFLLKKFLFFPYINALILLKYSFGKLNLSPFL